jgi:hypothetical protein
MIIEPSTLNNRELIIISNVHAVLAHTHTQLLSHKWIRPAATLARARALRLITQVPCQKKI